MTSISPERAGWPPTTGFAALLDRQIAARQPPELAEPVPNAEDEATLQATDADVRGAPSVIEEPTEPVVDVQPRGVTAPRNAPAPAPAPEPTVPPEDAAWSAAPPAAPPPATPARRHRRRHRCRVVQPRRKWQALRRRLAASCRSRALSATSANGRCVAYGSSSVPTVHAWSLRIRRVTPRLPSVNSSNWRMIPEWSL